MAGRFIVDLETDGLLDEVTQIHCAVATDIDTGQCHSFTNASSDYPGLDAFFDLYSAADLVVMHNGVKYDVPVLEKLKGLSIPRERIRDTIVTGRLLFPDIKQSDFDRARLWKEYVQATDNGWQWHKPIPKEFPGHMIGRHSLEAWGYRLGLHKGDYSKDMKAQGLDPWASWNPAMHSYMIQDAEVTLELWKRFVAREPSEQSAILEHRIAWLCAQIERNGFPFDTKAATELYGQLVDERESVRRELVGLFPNWQVQLPDFIPKRPNKTKGYLAGVPVARSKEVEFNPGSRDHIADRLTVKYGWKPEAHTDNGKPKVDEDVLLKLPYPEAQKLGRFFLLDKRISQIAEGDQAWLKVQKDGKIHAQYTTNGAVTGRATHSKPNISQVPRVSSPFGRDCRALFGVPDGWVQLGADQQGLELRCLASDMAAFDGGQLAKNVVIGDPHTDNQKAFGFGHRDTAKNCLYGICYGGGDERIGTFLIEDARRCKQPAPMKLDLRQAGRALKRKIDAGMPAFPKLRKYIGKAAERGWIKGIDGRKMPVRSPHKALNCRLQNAGAVLCKQWGCDWDDRLRSEGLRHGWDGDYVFLVWAHDEFQLAVRDDPEVIERVRLAGIETGRNAGVPYNFKCPLDVEVKIGTNWATCH